MAAHRQNGSSSSIFSIGMFTRVYEFMRFRLFFFFFSTLQTIHRCCMRRVRQRTADAQCYSVPAPILMPPVLSLYMYHTEQIV